MPKRKQASPKKEPTNAAAKRMPNQAKADDNVNKSKIKKGRLYKTCLKEIQHLQKTVDFLIPKAPFLRLVREILTRDSDFRITEMAVEALRESAEAFLIGIMEDAYLLSLHAKRVTLFQSDMQLVLNLRRDFTGF